jgi:hypothetical protein
LPVVEQRLNQFRLEDARTRLLDALPKSFNAFLRLLEPALEIASQQVPLDIGKLESNSCFAIFERFLVLAARTQEFRAEHAKRGQFGGLFRLGFEGEAQRIDGFVGLAQIEVNAAEFSLDEQGSGIEFCGSFEIFCSFVILAEDTVLNRPLEIEICGFTFGDLFGEFLNIVFRSFVGPQTAGRQ